MGFGLLPVLLYICMVKRHISAMLPCSGHLTASVPHITFCLLLTERSCQSRCCSRC